MRANFRFIQYYLPVVDELNNGGVAILTPHNPTSMLSASHIQNESLSHVEAIGSREAERKVVRGKFEALFVA